MAWTRASSLDRAVACPASTHLYQIRTKSENAQEAADWGTIIHHWKETGHWPSLKGRAAMPFKRRAAALEVAGVKREELWPVDGQHEVTYALNTVTKAVARLEAGTAEERDKWKESFSDDWITGTADYVGDVLGLPWVDDLKTGNPEYLPLNPWDTWQLKMYLLCAMLLCDAPAGWVSLTLWPRYPADNPPLPRRWYRAERHELVNVVFPLLERARQAAVASRTKLDARPGPQCGEWTDREGEKHYLCSCSSLCPVIVGAVDPFN